MARFQLLMLSDKPGEEAGSCLVLVTLVTY